VESVPDSKSVGVSDDDTFVGLVCTAACECKYCN